MHLPFLTGRVCLLLSESCFAWQRVPSPGSECLLLAACAFSWPRVPSPGRVCLFLAASAFSWPRVSQPCLTGRVCLLMHVLFSCAIPWQRVTLPCLTGGGCLLLSSLDNDSGQRGDRACFWLSLQPCESSRQLPSPCSGAYSTLSGDWERVCCHYSEGLGADPCHWRMPSSGNKVHAGSACNLNLALHHQLLLCTTPLSAVKCAS